MWLYTHIQSADLRRLDAVASGQLVTRSLTDLALIEQLLLVFPAIIAYMPLLIALGILVIILSPPMGILALSAVPLNLWLHQPLPGAPARPLVGRAQRARRGHAHHRRARARHPRA